MNKENSFDFDYWVKLAKTNPDAFEAKRKQAIDDYLAGTPEGTQDRLRRLQWRVEMERQRARNPMDAAIRIYDMMWDSVSRNMDALNELADMLAGQPASSSQLKAREATILSFKSRTGTGG